MSSPALVRRLDLIPSSLGDQWSFHSRRPVWTNFTQPKALTNLWEDSAYINEGSSAQGNPCKFSNHVLKHCLTSHRFFLSHYAQWLLAWPKYLFLYSLPRLVSGTLWVTLVRWVLSYFTGLLCGASVLNKIQIPLAACRLDLIKYPTDKGWANVSFNIIKRETRVHTSSKANNPFHTLLETLTTVMTTLH